MPLLDDLAGESSNHVGRDRHSGNVLGVEIAEVKVVRKGLKSY